MVPFHSLHLPLLWHASRLTRSYPLVRRSAGGGAGAVREARGRHRELRGDHGRPEQGPQQGLRLRHLQGRQDLPRRPRQVLQGQAQDSCEFLAHIVLFCINSKFRTGVPDTQGTGYLHYFSSTGTTGTKQGICFRLDLVLQDGCVLHKLEILTSTTTPD